jgi:DNA-binding NarL/FixJ family response regulator
MSDSQSIHILLVDDHTILRQGLKQLLETDPRLIISAEAGDGDEAILKALLHRPHVILMDINLPKVSGYEAARSILTAWADARILVLSNQDDPLVIQKFLDLGIKGYRIKDIQADLLISDILQVAQGHYVALSAELSEKIELLKSSTDQSPTFTLTSREKEVLKALCKGFSNQQLAELLTVSPKTVHNHLYNIYSKIGVNTRSEAIVWAIERGLNN